MYVCMYVCMYVYMYICIYVYMYMYMYVYMYLSNAPLYNTGVHLTKKQDQNLIIARGNLRGTLSYYIFVPHFVLQKSIIGSLPLSRREQ